MPSLCWCWLAHNGALLSMLISELNLGTLRGGRMVPLSEYLVLTGASDGGMLLLLLLLLLWEVFCRNIQINKGSGASLVVNISYQTPFGHWKGWSLTFLPCQNAMLQLLYTFFLNLNTRNLKLKSNMCPSQCLVIDENHVQCSEHTVVSNPSLKSS